MRLLREAHPTVPILVGGRDMAQAAKAAAEIGHAAPVRIDLTAVDLGLGDQRVGAVATLFTDETGAILRWAQRHGAGHVSISPGLAELGPEVATFINAPNAAPVVLGTEWLVGATSVSTLLFARAFGRFQEIRISALLDEEDDFGPAARADLERQTPGGGGRQRWFVATGALDIRFDLALDTSSTRRAGGRMSAEIVIDLVGEDHRGRPLRKRHAIVHREGQMPLTGLGVALVLERLAGLIGDPPGAGLYFPSQLIDHATYFDRVRRAGGEIVDLEPVAT